MNEKTFPVSIEEPVISWLLEEGQPWVRYRVFRDLLDYPEEDPEVQASRAAMIAHPLVNKLIDSLADWPSVPLTRHNDAKHPIHKLTVLADFGLTQDDPGMMAVIDRILKHQSEAGAFESLLLIPKAFKGSGQPEILWMLCDFPILLHALLRFGLSDHPAINRALLFIESLIRENGWPCAASTALPNFNGPGRKDQPCPYANLISLKALLASQEKRFQANCQIGTEMLLDHWENRGAPKIYMFGIGTTYQRLKFPFIWYDLLHVLDTLSVQSDISQDARIVEMTASLVKDRAPDGKFSATSVWMAWKDWDFGQKRQPSPWITFLVLRILKRLGTSNIST